LLSGDIIIGKSIMYVNQKIFSGCAIDNNNERHFPLTIDGDVELSSLVSPVTIEISSSPIYIIGDFDI